MARIEIDSVQKRFGAVVGVRDVNIDIADRELVVLLGPSGCGKTTTMRMIAGLEEPSEGEIRVDGEVMNGIDPRDRDVAMVFQGYALYPNMTIFENIRFPLRMRGVARGEQEALVRTAAQMVDLGDYLDRKPAALSGGQRQRAALARAIVRQPKVFLMDEPLSNLDAKLRQTMRAQIKHLQRRLATTTVYVTHDQIEAMTLADRIVVMEAGAIQQIGTPDEIYNAPANAFVAGFIGAPPMNLVAGRLDAGRFAADGIAVAGVPVAGAREATLGIRPEDCRIAAGPAEAHLQGTVYAVEPTGESTYLTVRTGGRQFEVKAPRDYRAEPGTPVDVAFDPARLYVFDAATGRRLTG